MVDIRGSGQYAVEVVDLLGRVVAASAAVQPFGYRLDVSGLPAGVYTVVVRQGEMLVRQPLTIVR